MWGPWSERGPRRAQQDPPPLSDLGSCVAPQGSALLGPLSVPAGTEGRGSWASGPERLLGPSHVTAWPPPSPVSRPPLAPNAQGTGSGGASPWPGGVLGMLLGELQTTAPPCVLAT